MNIKKLDMERIQNPDNRYWPVYSWVWNEALSEKEIKRQIDEMYGRGIRGLYVIPLPREFRPYVMVTDLQPPYLSDGYFEMLSCAVDYAASKGMQFWLYDEAGWPSGNANFTVTEGNEELGLCSVMDGELVTENKFSDLTNPKSTEKFIALTHQKHVDKMGGSFKNIAPFMFTDEPLIRPMPYTEAIKSEYKKRTGMELSLEKIQRRDDPDFNIIYHDICSQVFADNYFKPIKKWCNDNGIYSTGHINGEHDTLGYATYGHHYAMRLLRLLDVPGIDVIWGQVVPEENCLFFPRLASSAAEQNGVGLCVTESLSVYGNMTYEQMRYVLGYQLVRGINILNLMLIMYDDTGYYGVRQRPSFSSLLPGGEYLSDFNHYLASLQYILQNGVPDTDSALYMPVRDFWANDSDTEAAAHAYETMGCDIEQNHGQFDIADDDMILQCDTAALNNGELRIGRACYRILYIPASKYMPDEVKKRLDIFRSGGGRIYGTDDAEYFPLADIRDDDGYIRVHKRKYDNCDVYLMFNESANTVNARIYLPEGSFELSVPGGEKIALAENYTFCSGEMKIFVTDCETAIDRTNYSKGGLVAELSDFRFRPVKRYTMSKDCARYSGIDVSYTDVVSGDWTELVGEDFSGQCEYIADFSYDGDPQNLILSLGDVKYSCEIWLNGTHLKSLYMPPYDLTIDKSLIKEHNELVIKVSNTGANACVYFELPDEWEAKHIGPYHEISLGLEKELLHGGLVGPVKLYECKQCRNITEE